MCILDLKTCKLKKKTSDLNCVAEAHRTRKCERAATPELAAKRKHTRRFERCLFFIHHFQGGKNSHTQIDIFHHSNVKLTFTTSHRWFQFICTPTVNPLACTIRKAKEILNLASLYKCQLTIRKKKSTWVGKQVHNVDKSLNFSGKVKCILIAYQQKQ